MRRKSERTANKKVKSPEKKLEKVKRTRTRRRKQSTSSDESAEEATPVVEATPPAEAEEQKPPVMPVKEDSPEETPEQVWQVKTTEPADMGEIQKLKICLTRPPSTPERSPRSKRKHSRATSSSDTPSADGSEEKKKKHRSRRAGRESKEEDFDKTETEAPAENETKPDSPKEASKHTDEVTQSSDTVVPETPISTIVVEEQTSQKESQEQASAVDQKDDNNKTESKPSDADTTVADTTVASPKEKPSENADAQVEEKENLNKSEPEPEMPSNDSSSLVEKPKELKQNEKSRSNTPLPPGEPMDISLDIEVSKFDRNVSDDVTNEPESSEIEEKSKATNKTNDVVESSTSVLTDTPAKLNDSKGADRNTILPDDSSKYEKSVHGRKSLDRSDSTSSHKSLDRSDSTQGELPNGQVPPIVINRKRRWGSRPIKATPQKSIAISTDVLKDIIPDVKPVEFEEVIEERKIHKRVAIPEKMERPILPKIIIDNSENVEQLRRENVEKDNVKEKSMSVNRKISIVKENDSIITRPPSPPRHKQSCILYITNLVRPFTLMQLKNLLLRTGKIVEDGFWIDKIKSKCFVQYENEDQAVETRHALHGVTWPVSNPKTLQVDFSTKEAFDIAKTNVETEATQASAIPGTVEDWLREQDLKRERGEQENQKPWERKAAMREWDVGKNEKDKEKENLRRDDRIPDKIRRHRTIERSPEPAKKFKKKEEEAPSKLLDDLFRKTKTTPCIYWLPLSAETIAIKEEQRRAHMAENERRLQELRNRRRH